MNTFQTLCIQRCKELLAGIPSGSAGEFKEIVGKKERYYKAEVKRTNNSVIEIYIYLDEAGYMINGKDWTIFERPDYRSDDTLITKFIHSLRKVLDEEGDVVN